MCGVLAMLFIAVELRLRKQWLAWLAALCTLIACGPNGLPLGIRTVAQAFLYGALIWLVLRRWPRGVRAHSVPK